jgi:hypothetical protein
MSTSRLLLPVAILVAVSLIGERLCRTLAGGGDSERLLQVAGVNVSRLPETIGAWHRHKSDPLSDNVMRILGCRAQQSCVYADDLTGDQVALTLLAGSAGPLVAHTPEVCYSSIDADITEPAGVIAVRGTGERADTFDRVMFRLRTVEGRKQQVYYAWRKFDGPWQAPRSPRLSLGGQPMLYKLQLAGEAAEKSGDSPESDSVRRFLEDLLPVLDGILKPQ